MVISLYFQFAFSWILVKLNTLTMSIGHLDVIFLKYLFFEVTFFSLVFQNIICSPYHCFLYTFLYLTHLKLLFWLFFSWSFFQAINCLFNCVNLLAKPPIIFLILFIEFLSFRISIWMLLIFSSSFINFYFVFYLLDSIWSYFKMSVRECHFLNPLWVFFCCLLFLFYCCFAFDHIALSSSMTGYFDYVEDLKFKYFVDITWRLGQCYHVTKRI